MKKKRQDAKKKNKRFDSHFFLILSLSCLVVLTGLLLIQFISFGNVFEEKIEKRVSIVDDCSSFKGYGLIHQIRDFDDCRNSCVSACMARGLEFDKIYFSLGNNSCNECDCYCVS